MQIKQIKELTVDEIWDGLSSGLEGIYRQETLTKPQYMDLYTRVYEFCVKSQNLTDLHSKLYSLLNSRLRDLQLCCADLVDEDLLEFYSKEWELYRFASRVLNGICRYFNRQWSIAQMMETGMKVKFEIYYLALKNWHDNLLQGIINRLTNAILKLIARGRNGESVNTRLIREVLNSYVVLGSADEDCCTSKVNLQLYQNSFEKSFLIDTERFYMRENTDFLKSNSVIELRKKIHQRIQAEKQRAGVYLHESTNDKLVKTIQESSLRLHSETYFSEFQTALNENKVEDLRQLFLLVSHVQDTLNLLQTILQKHVSQEGKNAIASCSESIESNPIMYVYTAVQVYRKYSDIVRDSFSNHPSLTSALDDAVYDFVNNNVALSNIDSHHQSAEFLAKLSDSALKKTNRNLKETDLEDTIDQIASVFKYISDKDAFLHFYRKMLAKRLIFHSSISEDSEASMIIKLKQFGSLDDANLLHRMFQDIRVSKSANTEFLIHLVDSEKTLEIKFDVLVLSAGLWPLPLRSSSAFLLPNELEKNVSLFSSFYESRFTGRKLNWLYNMSRVELSANCFEIRHILRVSTFQTAVLLQFNSSDSLTITQLCDLTGIEVENLAQEVRTLIKSKLLRSKDDASNIQPSSVIQFCPEYKNKKVRVNVDQSGEMEQAREWKSSYKRIQESRLIEIQAAIVRIMKVRKILKHQSLLAEVLDLISSRFQPLVADVKKCIDILIEKEYLARSEDDNDSYQYI